MPTDEAWINRQIEDIKRQLRELGPSVAASFGPVIADLQAQQAALAEQVALQVSPAVASAAATGFTLDGTSRALAQVSFNVPAGFTRAVVSASGAVAGGTNSTGGDALYGNVLIAGVAYGETPMIISASSRFGNVAAFGAANLTGLNGGSFLVQVAGRITTGPGSNLATYANICAQVLFLR